MAIGLLTLLLAAAAASSARESPSPAGHVLLAADELRWGAGPASLPPGAQMAVLMGDPARPGPFAFRARLPPGFRIAPHWHPAAEHVTVLEGSYAMGTGRVFDTKALHAMTAGGFAVMPAEVRHFSYTKDGATIQVHGNGPFLVHYVNPADDPRNAAPAAK